MKRILILALMMLLILSGCAGSTEPDSSADSPKLPSPDELPPVEEILDELDVEDILSAEAEEPVDPDAIVSIIYDESYPTSEAIEHFWEDGTYIYSFPTIRSQYITVTYGDGSTQTICEALKDGKAVIDDLDRFGILYFKHDRVFYMRHHLSDQYAVSNVEDASRLYPLFRDAVWTTAETNCACDVDLYTEMGSWYYHTECGTLHDTATGLVCTLSEEERGICNEVIREYLGDSLFHSPLYLPDVSVEDVILWFNEVTLAAEFQNGGDASLVQKWTAPISVSVTGSPTEEDRIVLENFMSHLNEIPGFPGISMADETDYANLRIHFGTEEDMLRILGSNFMGCDGGVTFWYEDNIIYDADICILTDIDQYVRNSVIQEEIFNGLGPVQDTALREDSLIWQGYSTPQVPTDADWLILKLLYHPEILCGMNAADCEAVIRGLYW